MSTSLKTERCHGSIVNYVSASIMRPSIRRAGSQLENKKAL